MLHSLCQLASWAFVAVLITVLPRVGGENSPCGTISSGTFHQQENNCLPPQLGWDSHQAALGQDPREAAQCACSCARSARRGSHPPLLRAAQKGRAQCPGPVSRCQGRQRQTKSGAVGFSRGHGWAGGRASFSMFLGAPGVEVGCRTLPVSSSDGQDDGGRGWSGRNRDTVRKCSRVESAWPYRQNDLAPNPVSAH